MLRVGQGLGGSDAWVRRIERCSWVYLLMVPAPSFSAQPSGWGIGRNSEVTACTVGRLLLSASATYCTTRMTSHCEST
ncbi:hypothetical protein BDV93DRAFT_172844 [Ceratobasidium sp. AG-I]|nr:hypothetical protein BDV93DRAFT_172844 [Ceratobasidium sp. AG-I]